MYLLISLHVLWLYIVLTALILGAEWWATKNKYLMLIDFIVCSGIAVFVWILRIGVYFIEASTLGVT